MSGGPTSKVSDAQQKGVVMRIKKAFRPVLDEDGEIVLRPNGKPAVVHWGYLITVDEDTVVVFNKSTGRWNVKLAPVKTMRLDCLPEDYDMVGGGPTGSPMTTIEFLKENKQLAIDCLLLMRSYAPNQSLADRPRLAKKRRKRLQMELENEYQRTDGTTVRIWRDQTGALHKEETCV